MNWSLRFCASLSVTLSRLASSRDTFTSPPAPSTFGRRSIACFEAAAQAGDVDAGAGQERSGATVVLVQEGGEQVLGLDVRIVGADGETLGVGKRLLEAGREFVYAHGRLL
jgi:hypothetical protein